MFTADPIRSSVSLFILSLTVWIGWCLLMLWRPSPFANDNLRALVRVGCVLLPALWYAHAYALDFGLWPIRWSAVGLGAVVVIVLLGGDLWLNRPNSLTLPTGFAAYFNFIIGSPIAEELLFRGIIFQQFNKRLSAWSAIALSSILFVVFHWPWWLLSGEIAGMAFLSRSAFIFAIGILLAYLFKRTQSLWPPIIYHIANNFVGLIVG